MDKYDGPYVYTKMTSHFDMEWTPPIQQLSYYLGEYNKFKLLSLFFFLILNEVKSKISKADVTYLSI